MTNAVPIQTLDHLSVANTLRVLLRQAEQGKLDGFIYIASCVDEEDKVGLCGKYSDDLDAAITTASSGFNCLLGYKACIEHSGHLLPRRLRKESANDQTCEVLSCPSRRRVA